MAGKAKRHLVDGEWITVQEAADRLGISRQQMYGQMNARKCGLQAAVRLVRENLALGKDHRYDKHMVDGRWMSAREVVDMLGITKYQLRNWRCQHRDAQGRQASMQSAVDAYRSGSVVHRGRQPVEYRIAGKRMTVAQAAKAVGVSESAFRIYMSRHKVSPARAYRFYERRSRRQAEKDILTILGF